MEITKHSNVIPFPKFNSEHTASEYLALADRKPLCLNQLGQLLSAVLEYCQDSIPGFTNQLEALPCDGEPMLRHSSLLYHSPRLSAYLLSWPSGNPGTEIHDHGGSSAAIAVLCGAVRETIYDGRPDVRVRKGIKPLLVPHPYVHKFECEGDLCDRAVTLHLYSPGLTAMRFFDFKPSGLVDIGGWTYEGPNIVML